MLDLRLEFLGLNSGSATHELQAEVADPIIISLGFLTCQRKARLSAVCEGLAEEL